jgi:hypothetical protein
MRISKLQVEMDFWPDDDLLEASTYGYVGTYRLAEAIKKHGLTGVEFDHVDVIEGEQFFIQKDKHPGESVPELLWFKFIGKAAVDDFGLLQGPGSFPLVVSERALGVLKTFNFTECEIKDLYDSRVAK